ncbi:hypothetical protein MAR_034685 [Mya arenaria]|uniref:Uncharacterized protein n=1 Tax=Mya arenaria TaxID=6604 RepID=A0ABY7EKR9_MYAAR|nr:hypothetical protein MAR_034685 [Mya arenaria]
MPMERPCFSLLITIPGSKATRAIPSSFNEVARVKILSVEVRSDNMLPVWTQMKLYGIKPGRKSNKSSVENGIYHNWFAKDDCSKYSSNSDSSDFKDDTLVKSWVKQMREDFDHEAKACGVNVDADADQKFINEAKERLEAESVEQGDSEQLEKLGYTTEEYLAMLKDTSMSSGQGDGVVRYVERTADSHKGNNMYAEIEDKIVDDIDDFDVGESQYADGTEHGDSYVTLINDDEEYDGDVIDVSQVDRNAPAVIQSEENHLWSELEIEDFVNIAPAESAVEPAWIPPIPLTRGKSGVFDIEELITLLVSINAKDHVTIRIPPVYSFSDYMVIVSAKSKRHLKAMTEDLKWTVT